MIDKELAALLEPTSLLMNNSTFDAMQMNQSELSAATQIMQNNGASSAVSIETASYIIDAQGNHVEVFRQTDGVSQFFVVFYSFSSYY